MSGKNEINNDAYNKAKEQQDLLRDTWRKKQRFNDEMAADTKPRTSDGAWPGSNAGRPPASRGQSSRSGRPANVTGWAGAIGIIMVIAAIAGNAQNKNAAAPSSGGATTANVTPQARTVLGTAAVGGTPAPQVRDTGPRLGLGVENVTRSHTNGALRNYVLITSVESTSPLRGTVDAQDLIYQIDNQPIQRIEELQPIIRAKPVGALVTVYYLDASSNFEPRSAQVSLYRSGNARLPASSPAKPLVADTGSRLGLGIENVTRYNTNGAPEDYVLVTRVEPTSPLRGAVDTQDMIYQIDGQTIQRIEQAHSIIRAKPVGTLVTVYYFDASSNFERRSVQVSLYRPG